MEDIAKLANVSKSAVSFALSGKPGISAETRERILRIAKDSGYTPRNRSLAADKTKATLLFLAFTNTGLVLEQYYQQPFFRELIHFVEERCRTKGYSLLFSSVDMEHIERDIQSIAATNQSSGVILLGTNLSAMQIANIAEKLPHLVVLDNCYEALPIHFVEINNVMGAYQAASYLYEKGHREIGYIQSSDRIHNFDMRKRGFMAALRERGLEVNDQHYLTVAPTILSSQESLKGQLDAFIQSGGQLPTAMFCECDYIAISAMKTLIELGYRIPEDISIVGFDNISEAVIVSPELTTIHVEKETMAQIAVDLLIESIERGTSPRVKTKTLVDTRFMERHSCMRSSDVVRDNAN